MHWHIAEGSKMLPFDPNSFPTFAWALARCSVMMSDDQKVRRPVECEFVNGLHRPKGRRFENAGYE